MYVIDLNTDQLSILRSMLEGSIARSIDFKNAAPDEHAAMIDSYNYQIALKEAILDKVYGYLPKDTETP